MGSTEILVSGGVAAILAAIVGGGLKAFGIELPLLASVQRQGLLLVVGVALIGLGLYSQPSPAESAERPATPVTPGPAEPVASAPDKDSASARPTAAVATVRPDVPNIVGLPFSVARQFLMQNSWAPINTASSPMANDALGLRAREVFDAGYLEAVGCSGTGMAPCLFRYRHPSGSILEVSTIGEEITSAKVNRAIVLDCGDTPRPEGCEA